MSGVREGEAATVKTPTYFWTTALLFVFVTGLSIGFHQALWRAARSTPPGQVSVLLPLTLPDQEAIQSAMDFASKNGGIVRLGWGDYQLLSPLTVTGQNYTLEGNGMGGTKILVPPEGPAILINPDADASVKSPPPQPSPESAPQ